MIADGALLMDRFSEKLSVSLTMRSMDEREIHSVSVCIRMFNEKGKEYPELIPYKYSSLKLKRDELFGKRTRIPLPESGVRSFEAYVSEVTFSDYTTWTNEEAFLAVEKQQTLKEALGDEAAAKQYAARYGNDCVYMPTDADKIWYCTCGAVNRIEETKCHNCRRNRAALQQVNYDALKVEAAQSEEQDKKEDAEEQVRQKEKNERQRKILRIALTVLPFLFLVILIAATVPPFFERREAYSNAENLLEEGRYREAAAAFEELGGYLDSEEKSQREIPYEEALYILECAKKGDESGLTYLGLDPADLGEEEDAVSMLLYEKARELFTPLKGYRDADAKLEEIEAAFQAHEDRLVQAAYDEAAALLEKGAYLKARDAFLTFGDYSDTAEMAKECMYRRASSVLDFCEANNIRDIRVAISDSTDQKTLISMPGSVLTKLGSDTVYKLKLCFVEDGVEFVYEDEPSNPDLVPICDGVAAQFDALGEYKDSGALAERARTRGDFTAEFYSLLASGKLNEALNWLNQNDDEIPNRESYPGWIEQYQLYCCGWELHQGDSTLIPFSAGQEYTSLNYFNAWVSIEGSSAVLHLGDLEGTYSAELRAELGSTNFMMNPAANNYYYAIINQLDHLTYLRYTEDGTILSSCEYKRS